MPWYIYLALRQLFPGGKRIPFFTAVAILGVALGVMVLLIVQSVMGGFHETICHKIIEANGEIQVEAPGQVLQDRNELLETVRKHLQVTAAEPYAQGIVMLLAGERPAFPFIRGIEPVWSDRAIPVERFLKAGSLEDLDDESVFISSGLARILDLYLGSKVDIYSPRMLERLREEEVLLPREVKVAGIFETGWNQIDSNTVICSLRLMQELYGLEDGIHGLSLRLKPGASIDRIARELTRALPDPIMAFTWLENNRDFLFILQLEKTVMAFLIMFIIVVSAFSIMSTLMTTVVRRTREIGLLGAMGSLPWQTAAIYSAQGLIIGVTGTVIGLAGGFAMLHWRNAIVGLLTRLTQSEAAFQQFYQFTHLPARIDRTEVLVIAGFAVLISILAGVLPALRAARLNPAEALRSDVS